MCTYVTETLPVTGSAKGATGWIRVTDATVYYDHPVHALADHTLNIDLRRPADGVAARLGIELSADSARSLAETILAVLASAEAAEGGRIDAPATAVLDWHSAIESASPGRQ